MPAGIYKITNKNNKKMYVGSSINIEQRKKDHFNMLKNNKHHSKELQGSYNRTKDKNVFKFEIIEEVKDETELKVREQYYINLYDSMFNGYNCNLPLDSLKYITKNKKVRLRDKYFDEFAELYNQYTDILIFSGKFLGRLLDKHYKSPVYSTINYMINWFIDNYGMNYKVEITAYGNQQYYLCVNDQQENRIAFYKYSKGKMYNSKCDTDMCIENLKKNNIYNEDIHYLIEVPNFNY
jgi:hypothetical protein